MLRGMLSAPEKASSSTMRFSAGGWRNFSEAVRFWAPDHSRFLERVGVSALFSAPPLTVPSSQFCFSLFSLHTVSILTNPSSLPSQNKYELHVHSLGELTSPRFTGFLSMYPNLRI